MFPIKHSHLYLNHVHQLSCPQPALTGSIRNWNTSVMPHLNHRWINPHLVIKVSESYRPEARGYVIYSPCALPKGIARGQHMRGINHITTSWRPITGLFLLWREFLKGPRNTLVTNAVIFCFHFFLTIHGDIGVNEAHIRQSGIFDANSIVFFCLMLIGR